MTLAARIDRASEAIENNLSLKPWHKAGYTYWLHLCLFFAFGPLCYVLVAYLRSPDYRVTGRRKIEIHINTIVVAIVLFVCRLYFSAIDLLSNIEGWFWILEWWIYGLALFPLQMGILFAWEHTGKNMFLRDSDVEAMQAYHQEQRRLAGIRDARKAKRASETGVEPEKNVLFLGGHASSKRSFGREKIPEYLGFVFKHRTVSMVEKILDRHMFVLGTTGAGKSETLLRIILEVLQKTDRRIYVVDGKGDMEFANVIATLAHQYRGEQVPVFQIGRSVKGSVYHGFMGNKTQIFNRLSAMVGIREAEGGAQFYARANAGLLQLVCGISRAVVSRDVEPPRSFDQVVDRLTESWLLDIYGDTHEEGNIEAYAKEGHINSLRNQMAVFGRTFGGMIDKSGFTLESTKAAVFSLRTQSAGVDSKNFLDFFIEDVKDFIGNRQPKGSKGLLIIDEFGTFKNQNITDVLSLARSAGLGVILATQDVATLGESQNLQRRILANCNTYIVMKTNFPEEVAELAGTIMQIETSYALREGQEMTGAGSGREQHTFKIQPNEVAQLRPGECFIINSRYAPRVNIERIPEVKVNPEAVKPRHEVMMRGTRRTYVTTEVEEVPNTEIKDILSGIK